LLGEVNIKRKENEDGVPERREIQEKRDTLLFLFMLTRKITLAINTPILFFFIHLLLSLCDCLIMGSSHVTANGHAPLDSGHARLKELGYKQELKRDLS